MLRSKPGHSVDIGICLMQPPGQGLCSYMNHEDPEAPQRFQQLGLEGPPLLPGRLCQLVLFPTQRVEQQILSPSLEHGGREGNVDQTREQSYTETLALPTPYKQEDRDGGMEMKGMNKKIIRDSKATVCPQTTCPTTCAWPLSTLMLWPSQSGILVCPKRHLWPLLSPYLGFKGMKETQNGQSWPKLREDVQQPRHLTAVYIVTKPLSCHQTQPNLAPASGPVSTSSPVLGAQGRQCRQGDGEAAQGEKTPALG